MLSQKETTKADRKAVQMKLKAKERYDRHSRSLPNLPVGVIVRTQHPVNAGRMWVKSLKNAMEAAAFWCNLKVGELTGETGVF